MRSQKGFKLTLIETKREFLKSCEEIEQEAERWISSLKSENEVFKVRLETLAFRSKKGNSRKPSLHQT